MAVAVFMGGCFRFFFGGSCLWLKSCAPVTAAIEAADRLRLPAVEPAPVDILSVDLIRRFTLVPPRTSFDLSCCRRRRSRLRLLVYFIFAIEAFLAGTCLGPDQVDWG